MTKDGGGGYAINRIVWIRWISRVLIRLMGLALLGIAMYKLPFRLTIFDYLTIRHFEKSLPIDERKLFQTKLNGILQEERHFMTDRITQGHIIFVASVLSTYLVAAINNPDEQSIQQNIRNTIFKLGGRGNRFLMRVARLFYKDSLSMVEYVSKQKMLSGYGSSFDIKMQHIENGFVTEVMICGYRNFLARHDALHLNAVLCEWDKVWIGALPDDLLFCRPCTLADGHKSCRFEFRLKS